MRAVVYGGTGRVRVEDGRPEPDITHPRDAIVKVSRAAICGTDLHPYRGEIPGFGVGTVLGHEFVGTVESAGDLVPYDVGEPVVASDIIACGTCGACLRGLHYHCDRVTLFGYSSVVGAPVDGGQADYVRVPYADIVLSRRPSYISEEAALFVGDTLTTALTAVERADVRPGHVVAVVGAGSVGLLSGLCAQVAGAALVVVSDPAPARRMLAEKLGLTAVSPGQLEEVVRVDGEGADAVIEAVGSYPALAAAVNAAGRRATVAVAGAHHGAGGPFPAGHAFSREATVTFVVGNPIRTRDEAVALLRSGRLDPTVLVSHRLPLSEAAQAYELFDQGVASKVVLEVDV